MKSGKNNKKDDPLAFLGLDEMGINMETINGIKLLIPKLIVDFARGLPKFAMEEKNLADSIQNNTEQKRAILNENIFSFRTVLLTITGFSLTIIGVVISGLSSDNTIFHNLNFLYAGLVFLGLNVFGSILLIFYIYTRENNYFYKLIKFNDSLLSETRELLSKYLKEGTFEQYLAEKNKLFESKKAEEKKLAAPYGLWLIKGKDWTPHVLGLFFLLGVLLIVVSFFS